MRRCRDLLVTVAQPSAVEYVHLAGLDTGDLSVDLAPPSRQLAQPCIRIGLGTERHLPQQIEDRVQSRLGSDEGTLLEGPYPGDGLLDRDRGVVVRLVRVRRVVLAQPAVPRRRPVVQIRLGRLWERPFAQALVERVQLVVQALNQIRTGDRPYPLLDEDLVEEAQHQSCVAGRQQPPRSALFTQSDQTVVAQVHVPALSSP